VANRPDIGKGGLLEQLDRFPFTFGVLVANTILFAFCVWKAGFAFRLPIDVLEPMGGSAYTLIPSEPWRLLTSAFLHYDVIHFGLNGIALFLIGRVLEVHYGSARTWVLYVGCVVGGGLASAGYHYALGQPVLSAGASGGTVGLVVLGYVFASGAPERLGSVAHYLRGWIVVILIFSLVGGFVLGGIDHAAHAGGALVGGLCGWLVRPKPGADAHPAWTPAAHVLALLCLASFAAVVWKLRQGGG